MKALLIDHLTNPNIYNICRYYIYGVSTEKTVYIGEGNVLILEDFQEGIIEIIYTYGI